MTGGYGFAGLRRKSVSLLERQVGMCGWCFFFLVVVVGVGMGLLDLEGRV